MEKKFKRRLDELIKEIEKYNPQFDRELLLKAYKFSYDTHKEQLRLSGKPYFIHCIEVAKIMVELKMDLTTIICGLLHDCIEDSQVTREELREEFSEKVADIVNGVTKIGEIKYKRTEEQRAENFRRIMFSMVKDIRVIIVKFGDRLNNMRTLEFHRPKKRELIALETLEIYAPLAQRLGISRIGWELEDLSLKVLDEEAYTQLVRKIKASRKERERYVDKVKEPLLKSLEKSGIKANIEGRAKHFNSIYRKMKRRNCSFEEIYDLFAVRIIVDKMEDCYYALGIVHTLFPPIRERFKDFIATPKLGGYQSIHTTVIGPEGKRVEIQIRTHEMHFNADLGIAAHWRYKQGKTGVDMLDKQLESIRAIIEGQDDTSPTEFIEYLKIDLFQEEVFVFTPRGDMIRLPVGATQVDFAFEVHTDIGLHCIGAKVNGRVVPLNTELQSGDTVEILTTSAPCPDPDWITFTKTSKARKIIKKWIKDSLNQQSIELGKELLLGEFKTLKNINIDEALSSASKKLGFSDTDALYGSVGRGETTISSVAKKLPEKYILEFQKKRFIKRMIKGKSPLQRGIRVLGMGNISISLGKCCNPIPGDKIQGVIPKGINGVTVHRADCSQLLNKNYNLGKFVPVVWETDNTEMYSVGFKLVGEDRKGFLKDVVSVISDLDANIVTADIKVKDSIVTDIFLVEVLDLQQLTAIIRDISRIKGVISIERFINNNAKLK